MPTVTVQSGDTLWQIAQRELGDGNRWREITGPNGQPFTEETARRLQPGTVLNLPYGQNGAQEPSEGPQQPIPTLMASAPQRRPTPPPAGYDATQNAIPLRNDPGAAPTTPPIPTMRPGPPIPTPRPFTGGPVAAGGQQYDFASMSLQELGEVVRNADLTPEQMREVMQILSLRRQQAEGQAVTTGAIPPTLNQGGGAIPTLR